MGDKILYKYEYDVKYSKKQQRNNDMIKFSRFDISTAILKTGQAVLMRGSLPSSMYDCSLPSPHTSAYASKVTCMQHAEKVQHS